VNSRLPRLLSTAGNNGIFKELVSSSSAAGNGLDLQPPRFRHRRRPSAALTWNEPLFSGAQRRRSAGTESGAADLRVRKTAFAAAARSGHAAGLRYGRVRTASALVRHAW